MASVSPSKEEVASECITLKKKAWPFGPCDGGVACGSVKPMKSVKGCKINYRVCVYLYKNYKGRRCGFSVRD